MNELRTSTGTRRVSVKEAADLLGVSRHTLRRWLALRLIPFHYCGRRVVLDPRDLEQFLTDNRVEAIR
jgi:excisionase family DNA binding protein